MEYIRYVYVFIAIFTALSIYRRFQNKYENTLLIGLSLVMICYEVFTYMNTKLYMNVNDNLFKFLIVAIFYITYKRAMRYKEEDGVNGVND